MTLQTLTFEVYAMRGDGRKVLVSVASSRVDLLALKARLVMNSIEFGEEVRLVQYRSKRPQCFSLIGQ